MKNVTTKEVKETAAIGMKALKQSSEVENFYRFIHDNNLRNEAYTLMSYVLEKISPKSKKRRKNKSLQ